MLRVALVQQPKKPGIKGYPEKPVAEKPHQKVEKRIVLTVQKQKQAFINNFNGFQHDVIIRSKIRFFCQFSG